MTQARTLHDALLTDRGLQWQCAIVYIVLEDPVKPLTLARQTLSPS